MSIFDIFRTSTIKKENEQLKAQFAELGVSDIFAAQEKLSSLNSEITSLNNEITDSNETIFKLRNDISSLNEEHEKILKKVNTQSKKLSKYKELYESVQYAINNFFDSEVSPSQCRLSDDDYSEYEQISPSVILNLHCMDVKDLKKAFRDNQKQIDTILSQYSSRYTTKANKTIYNLMVIALQAELQNILYNLKYEKLDKSIEDVKKTTAKYLKLASEGNQSIVRTLTRFIGEIEYLFINAIKIEYNYHLRKEQARQEQLAIKEQMRQEAEERKALEAEKKKIEREESKYQTEIDKLQSSLSSASSDPEKDALNARILELQSQLASVVLKKEDIVNLQNGKAGNVYVISNIGSFGENVFKIGMTRRLDPQDRINELGSASVPFKFDVHSFIFSQDAVALEKRLHEELNEKRLNKVNLRKEFFKIDIDELAQLVSSIDPTAEFNKTAIAEEYYQSLDSEHVYSEPIEQFYNDEE